MAPWAFRLVTAVLIATTATACAVNAAGHTTYEQQRIDESVARAIEHAAFFHPDCSASDIRVKRMSQDGRLLELSVCGTVRRYQDVSPEPSRSSGGPTWVDVTAATGS
jgi:hypothetical protein